MINFCFVFVCYDLKEIFFLRFKLNFVDSIRQLLKLLSTSAQAKFLLRSQRDKPEDEETKVVEKKPVEVKKRGLVSAPRCNAVC